MKISETKNSPGLCGWVQSNYSQITRVLKSRACFFVVVSERYVHGDLSDAALKILKMEEEGCAGFLCELDTS